MPFTGEIPCFFRFALVFPSLRLSFPHQDVSRFFIHTEMIILEKTMPLRRSVFDEASALQECQLSRPATGADPLTATSCSASGRNYS